MPARHLSENAEQGHCGELKKESRMQVGIGVSSVIDGILSQDWMKSLRE